MVDQEVLTMVRDVVTILGVIGGFTYYVFTVRNQNQARKTQVFMQLYERLTDKEIYDDFWKHIESEWIDYDDFQKKYDHTVNPEHASIRQTAWNYFAGLGLLLKKGMVDEDTVYRLAGVNTLLVWFKWETVIKRLREGALGDDYMENFEYLANKMLRLRKENKQSIPVELLHSTSTLIKELS